MIARVWTAETTSDRTGAYLDHLRARVIPELKGIAGFHEAMVLGREDDEGRVDVQVLTFWESLDAIRAFAGEDVEAAVVPDEAARLLGEHDRRARHFEVVLREGPR